VVVVLLGLCFFAARSCQNSQIKITQDEAVALAKEQIDFVSQNTQIRLLRQGLSRHPYWIVSLSIPAGEDTGVFKQLAVVRIDATSGEVASVEQQGLPKDGQGDRPREDQKEP
jgi:hypothetical protein